MRGLITLIRKLAAHHCQEIGNGEAPNATLGFKMDLSFSRFGCPYRFTRLICPGRACSVGRTPIWKDRDRSRRKSSRVIYQPLAYWRGYRQTSVTNCDSEVICHCPALTTTASTVMALCASRSVTWHSRLYPERHPDTLKSSFIDTDTSVLCPTCPPRRFQCLPHENGGIVFVLYDI